MEPFLLRALLAGLGLAIISAPLGCILVWRRMAFFGETVAHASLIGIALSLALGIDRTGGTLAMALLAAAGLVFLSRQNMVPIDSLISVLSHTALALGVMATALIKGPSIDLTSYLFGDIFAVAPQDLAWLAGGGSIVAIAMWWLWQPLVATAVHEELAAAEGVDTALVKAAFILMLALVVAIAMKVVGVLLTVAFLIIPAATARPLSRTPEQMALLAALVAAIGVVAGLALSWRLDAPGGPSIVVALSALAAASLTTAAIFNRK